MGYRVEEIDFDRMVAELQREIIEQERAIYSDKVIEEFYNPKNLGRMSEPDARGIVQGWCGDTVEIYLRLNGKDRRGHFHDRWLRADGGLREYAHQDGDGDAVRESGQDRTEESDRCPGRSARGEYPLRRTGGEHAAGGDCKSAPP